MVLAEIGTDDRATMFVAIGRCLGAETSSDMIDIMTILGQKGLLSVQANGKSIVIHSPYGITRVDRRNPFALGGARPFSSPHYGGI